MSDSDHPRSARILVLSPDGLPLASLQQLVYSLTSTSGDEQTAASKVTSVPPQDHKKEDDDDDEEDGFSSFVTTRSDNTVAQQLTSEASHIPWTIDNDYYTAEVYFRLLSLDFTSSTSTKRASEARRKEDETLRARLGQELKDVSAVVLIVRGGQTKQEHQRVVDLLDATSQEAEWLTAEADEEKEEEHRGAGETSHHTSPTASKGGMPIGFGLSISTVVALPAIYSAHSSKGSSKSPASRMALIDLYAQNGWEYIDLAADAGEPSFDADLYTSLLPESDVGDDGSETHSSLSDEDEGDGNDVDDDDEQEGETKGLERVREALEANLWPGLIRKERPTGNGHNRSNVGSQPTKQDPLLNNSSSSKLPQDRLNFLSEVLDAHAVSMQELDEGNAVADASLDAELDSLFRRLDLNLPSAGLFTSTTDLESDNVVHVEPTAHDEELARRFLASIADFEKIQLADQVGEAGSKNVGKTHEMSTQRATIEAETLPENEEQRNRNQAEALRKLEEWLQAEDGGWPDDGGGGGSSANGNGNGVDLYDSGGRGDAQEEATTARSTAVTGSNQQEKEKKHTSTSPAFDDDFDDFVFPSDNPLAGPASFPFDEELTRHPHYKPARDRENALRKADGDGDGSEDGDGEADVDLKTPFAWPPPSSSQAS